MVLCHELIVTGRARCLQSRLNCGLAQAGPEAQGLNRADKGLQIHRFSAQLDFTTQAVIRYLNTADGGQGFNGALYTSGAADAVQAGETETDAMYCRGILMGFGIGHIPILVQLREYLM
jgi:hypothetical protein